MISWLQGILLDKRLPSVVLNVNGVGYEVEVPMSALHDLPTLGEQATLHIHMVVREDAQLLFGFNSSEQRDLFRSLIKVNGVGPKVALAVLSTLSGEELMGAMVNEDVSQLCKVPGIGKKTAQRLVVELKDRLEKEFANVITASTETDTAQTSSINAQQDAIAALIALGYKASQASRVVKSLSAESGEELIRQSLRILSGKVL